MSIAATSACESQIGKFAGLAPGFNLSKSAGDRSVLCGREVSAVWIPTENPRQASDFGPGSRRDGCRNIRPIPIATVNDAAIAGRHDRLTQAIFLDVGDQPREIGALNKREEVGKWIDRKPEFIVPVADLDFGRQAQQPIVRRPWPHLKSSSQLRIAPPSGYPLPVNSG